MFTRHVAYVENDLPKILHISIATPVVVTKGEEASCVVTFSGSLNESITLRGIDEMQVVQIALNFVQQQIDSLCGEDWRLE